MRGRIHRRVDEPMRLRYQLSSSHPSTVRERGTHGSRRSMTTWEQPNRRRADRPPTLALWGAAWARAARAKTQNQTMRATRCVQRPVGRNLRVARLQRVTVKDRYDRAALLPFFKALGGPGTHQG